MRVKEIFYVELYIIHDCMKAYWTCPLTYYYKDSISFYFVARLSIIPHFYDVATTIVILKK